jgi:predicted N-acetyltransferase YhbS
LTRDFLTENDYGYLYDSIRLIAFELGLRFLTDYLEGNVYFKARHREHNLARALVQFKLTESIESQERAIRALVQEMR